MGRRLAYPKRSHPLRRYPGPRQGPLDNGQKAALCILAREAFEHCGGERGTGGTFEAWRHDEQRKACGKDSLRFASQLDYKPLLAHFLNLKGESAKAFNLLREQQTSERDLALRKLAAVLNTAGLAESYADKICFDQNKVRLDRATPKQIWRVVFTITARGSSKKRKQDEAGRQEAKNMEEDPF